MAASEVQSPPLWEVETDLGWVPLRSLELSEGASIGEEVFFARGSFRYKAIIIGPGEGVQENLANGCRRRLRLAAACPASLIVKSQPPLTRRGSELHWHGNFCALRQKLLAAAPLLAFPSHPAHGALARAEAAEVEGRWEAAFNELFAAQECLASLPTPSAASTAPCAAAVALLPAASSSLKRTVSCMLGETVGESRRVSRRLLDDVGGNQVAAIERALLIRDLEDDDGGQLELNSEAAECSICCETGLGPREVVRFRPCQHGWYCVTCIQRAADAKIAEGATLGAIGCLECKRSLSERLLRALLTERQMEKLHWQGLESAVAACAELRPCPTPDCANRVVLEDGVEPRLRCELCSKEHCLLCSASPFHVGKTCEENLTNLRGREEEVALRRWMAEVGAKQCPKCNAVVTKRSLEHQATQMTECHKMMCRTCRTRFCFGCLALLTETSTCGCTGDDHGFVDPLTGSIVNHLAPRSYGRSRRARGGWP